MLNKNIKNDSKRQKFLKHEQVERAKRIVDEEVNFLNLVKQKYSNLGQSIEDLGNTIKNLYSIKIHNIGDVNTEILDFENFIISKRLLNRGYLSKRGIYLFFI